MSGQTSSWAGHVLVVEECPWEGCGKTEQLVVDASALARWQAGVPIQVAFPDLTRAQREFLKLGYCTHHMALLFGL